MQFHFPPACEDYTPENSNDAIFLFPNQLESAIRHYDLTVPMEKKYCMSVDFSMKDFYCY